MASKAKVPEALTQERVEKFKQQAIKDRGGQCLACPHKEALRAIEPRRLGVKLTAATIAVRVSCSLDKGRNNPHKGPGTCPTIRHHERKQSAAKKPAPMTG